MKYFSLWTPDPLCNLKISNPLHQVFCMKKKKRVRDKQTKQIDKNQSKKIKKNKVIKKSKEEGNNNQFILCKHVQRKLP